ncbi:MAG: DUF4358 domain-containing protein [Lachnospiraceae bacterium]|nr:DUF4358 domain-containing protein [Lachnospiraceae bacterium]
MNKIILAELLAVLLLAGVMFLLLYKKDPADVPLTLVNDALTGSFSTDGMEPAGDMRFKRSYGLNAADYEEILYYIPDNTMSVNEFLVVKCVNEADTDTVVRACEARLATQKKAFDGYGTNQTALLNHAELYSSGPYVCLFVSEQASEWLAAVKQVWGE